MKAFPDEHAVTELFAAPVAACIATPGMFTASVLVEEEAYIRKAVPKRQSEYAAGRAAARMAIAKLGGGPEAISADSDRSPRWPIGFRGSITHCEGFCSAVVVRSTDAASVGFDAELADPLGQELCHLVCRPSELAYFDTLSRIGVDWPKLAFSAKEAFYKCYYPCTRSFLWFRDVSVFFSVTQGAKRGGDFAVVMENETKPMPRRSADFVGRWMAQGDRIYTGVTLPPA